MFKIIEGDFKNNIYGNEEYLDNWPMLYLLENGKQIYIGESNHVKTRMTQHSSNIEKKIFDKVHFIYSKIFNQSVTFDYESKLIQYIVADELFQVTNKNSGIADKQYYKKQEYDKKFEFLWRKLQREKLVKHSLEEIENSDLFKYFLLYSRVSSVIINSGSSVPSHSRYFCNPTIAAEYLQSNGSKQTISSFIHLPPVLLHSPLQTLRSDGYPIRFDINIVMHSYPLIFLKHLLLNL